jgi:gluconate 2-dehydrogenase gamma chain
MNRRQFLEDIAGLSALLPGLSLLPGTVEAFAAGVHARASSVGTARTLSPAQEATLRLLAELLLPETDTIGASRAGVSGFIDVLLTEAMLPEHRERFLAGLAAIDACCQALCGKGVAAAPRAAQEDLLHALDAQLPVRSPSRAELAARARAPVTAEGGYAWLKGLVVFAYFTAEPVARGLINAPIIPGRYDGCVPV